MSKKELNDEELVTNSFQEDLGNFELCIDDEILSAGVDSNLRHNVKVSKRNKEPQKL